MKRFGPLVAIALAMVGILFIASALLALGHAETGTRPEADSYSPSGAAAFADLLRRNGYDVRIDRTSYPALQPTDLVVAFRVTGVYDSENGPLSGPAAFLGLPSNDRFQAALKQHLKQGGPLLILPVTDDFHTASANAAPIEITRVGSSQPVQAQSADLRLSYSMGSVLQSGQAQVTLYSTPSFGQLESYAWLGKQGNAVVGIFADGLLATNRFIAHYQNARVLLDMVRTLQPKGRIVFTNASFEQAEDPSFIQTLGAWAEGGWYQLLFLLLVIGYTLGRRFGNPDVERRAERGAREFLDALADLYARAKAAWVALAIVARYSDQRVRSYLKLPMAATAKVRDERLPEPLKRALTRVEFEAQANSINAQDAAKLVRNLDAQLADFIPARQPRKRRKSSP